MGSSWRKLKLALGLNLNPCVNGPSRNHVANSDDDESLPSSAPQSVRRSDAALLPMPDDWTADLATLDANKMKISKRLSRSSSKRSCSICLASMRRGDGQAIFTAECSHSFHFQCIASNVRHGNRICPICRAKWKDIPLQGPSLQTPKGQERINTANHPPNNGMMTVIRQIPPPRSNSKRVMAPLFQVPEPAVFNDDDPLELKINSTGNNVLNQSLTDCDDQRKVSVKTYTEVSAVPRSSAIDNFTVLLHLKAPCSSSWHNISKNDSELHKISQTPRAPVDLVTVLDTSASMTGTKLALLKRAMGFVIQNLGHSDRLAVIAFSSTAWRLFPLRRMSEAGRQQALQAVNSLVANGGTNIAEGLRKGAKIMEDRREKNPVSSIILLSDGQDTYTVKNAVGSQNLPDYRLLLPLSIRPDETSGFKIPVHTFGFGADHDASSMYSISEVSGGTFSFIETEGVIQDAFAQCIGGLLSVVVKDLHVRIECGHPEICLGSLQAGSYPNRVFPDQRIGAIDVGDLYADEERDFLISINMPTEISNNETSLLKISCVYDDPLTEEMVTLEVQEVRIERSNIAEQEEVSIEVDRQMNRIQAAEAMAQARTAAENGNLAGAVSILETIRKLLLDTVSAKTNDKLCVALDAELKEMQERMETRHIYEASGRAYILSGLSSHSWQRATARGDSTCGSSLIQAYQTPSMVEMVSRSQETLLKSPSAQRLLRPAWSFGSLLKQR